MIGVWGSVRGEDKGVVQAQVVQGGGEYYPGILVLWWEGRRWFGQTQV